MSSERCLGFGAEGRIPFSSIRSFAAGYGITAPDHFEWFRAVMRGMDDEYLGLRVPKPQGQVANEVRVDDVKAVRGLLSRLAKKPPTEEALSQS